MGSVAKPTYCLSMSWWGRAGQGHAGVPGAARCLGPYPAQARGQQGRVPREGSSQWQKWVRACGQRPWRWKAGGGGGWRRPRGLRRDRDGVCVRVEGGRRHSGQGGVPPLGGGQRAPGPRPLTHAQGPQRLEKPPPQYSPLLSVRGGRPRLAPIQPRGWLAAATAEQGLFIDSGAQPPAASGAHPRTPALRLPSHPRSVRGGRAHS